MHKTLLITGAALTCLACSPETSVTMRQQPSAPAQPPITEPDNPPITEPDNPPVNEPPIDAGIAMPPPATRDCSPGLYLGTYDCELDFFGIVSPLVGDVAFNLSINEMTVDGECAADQEFCPDLVISENGGTLFGLAAGLWGFETQLEGALDCTTGEFRATGLGGRWGAAVSSDPDDPDALWTVEDPPAGMFDGELMGMHTTVPTETIVGEWFLLESGSGITCTGPFTVSLQP